MENFNSFGVNYILDPKNNSSISNFNWVVGKLKRNDWEDKTFEEIASRANPNKSALDLGSWIGITPIALSRSFKHVYAFEPDPIARGALTLNLETSNVSNVDVFPYALYNKDTPVSLNGRLGASETRIGELPQYPTNVAKAINFEKLSTIIPFDEISFVKVDIEGSEEHIMEDLFTYGSKYKWDIYIELHPQFMSDSNLDRFNSLFNLYPNMSTYSKIYRLFTF